MDTPMLSIDEFDDLLRTGEIHRRVADDIGPLVAVVGDEPDDQLDPGAIEQLGSLSAVVLGVGFCRSDPQPVWADLVVAPESPELARTVASVESNPSAAVTLAMLIRHSEHRSIAEGLVAESAAYGLLQSGPEFAAWRSGRAARDRRSPTEPPVLVARHGDELSIVLNRPDALNALNTRMRDGLDNALQIAICDPSVNSVRLAGSGSSFCNGGDLDEFGSRPDPVTAHLVRLQRSLGRSLATVADRTTVHIHGRTSGSGIELAAFANLVVADPSTVISLPELQLGLIPGAGGTVSLPRRIGRHATMLLALGLPSINAQTALHWGLVDSVVR